MVELAAIADSTVATRRGKLFPSTRALKNLPKFEPSLRDEEGQGNYEQFLLVWEAMLP